MSKILSSRPVIDYLLDSLENDICDVEEISRLIGNIHDKDINKKDRNDSTILILAVRKRLLDIVKLLLENICIDVNIQDNNGFTALIWATLLKLPDIVRLLLQNTYIDVNLRDNDGCTALGYASRNNYTEIISILRSHRFIYGIYTRRCDY